MEKESNFRETWKMRIWMFLKMVNWICKKYCGFVAATGCVFGTIELYVMTKSNIDNRSFSSDIHSSERL